MDDEAGLLRAIHEEPGDWTNWLVLADCLDERGLAARAEFMRLYVEMRRTAWGKVRVAKRTRTLELLAQGVRPYLPAIANSLGMTFVLIPPGVFRMGSRPTEKERFADEGPVHEVELTRPFYLGVQLVTQRNYEQVMRRNPSAFRAGGDYDDRVAGLDVANFPVEQVSWEDAVEFCRRLSGRAAEKRAGRVYRLPTEAEWEYAARAGVSSQRYFLRDVLRAEDANFLGGPSLPCPVGSYPPNALGLYDMSGNVWEWCQDWFETGYYERSPRQDPPGPSPDPDDESRTFRGGSWLSHPRLCRAACRSADGPRFTANYLGFRVALSWTRELAFMGALG